MGSIPSSAVSCRTNGTIPDLLAARVRHVPYEKEGVSFAFQFRVDDGVFYIAALVQSRHERAAEGVLRLMPEPESAERPTPLSTLELPFFTGPAGLCVVSLPVPVEWQGHSAAFDLEAQVHWPHGKGQALRVGAGVGVRDGKPSLAASGLFHLLGFLYWPIGLFHMIFRTATNDGRTVVRLRLPAGLADGFDPANYVSEPRVLWQMGDPLPAWYKDANVPAGLTDVDRPLGGDERERFDPFASSNQ